MDRTYVIRLENGTSGSSQGISPIAGDNSETPKPKQHGLLSPESAKTFMAGFVAYKGVKSFTQQVVSHEISLVQLRTGSNEMQQQANFAYEVVNTAVSMAEVGITTALVTGNLPAAGLMAVTTLATKGVEWIKNQDRINTAKSVENQTIQRNIIRAGATGSRSNRL